MYSILSRIVLCVKESIPKSLKTCLWLLKIMLPIGLVVRLLDYYGIIADLSVYLQPVFEFIGLRGNLAIVFVTSVFVSLYATIAVMASLPMSLREATILTLMCLIAHSLPVECAVTKRTGSPFFRMVSLRVGMAFIAAILLNLILPYSDKPFEFSGEADVYANISDVFTAWGYSSLELIAIVILIVTSLMILQRILIEFNWIDILSRPLNPLMKLFGLPEKSSFLWIVGNIVGLAYGGAIMIDMVKDGHITYKEANTVNWHLAISHSLLEDTILFVLLGINVWVIILTRVGLAIAVVWIRRLVYYLKDRSFVKS